jgi:hypothetical protein
VYAGAGRPRFDESQADDEARLDGARLAAYRLAVRRTLPPADPSEQMITRAASPRFTSRGTVSLAALLLVGGVLLAHHASAQDAGGTLPATTYVQCPQALPFVMRMGNWSTTTGSWSASTTCARTPTASDALSDPRGLRSTSLHLPV